MSCPFAGMTRIRFKGFPRYWGGSLSSLPELPSEHSLMYARPRPCQRMDASRFACPGRTSCPCPARRAARSGAPQMRDRSKLGVRNDPGSAAHHSALTRFVLRCARETYHCALHRIRDINSQG